MRLLTLFIFLSLSCGMVFAQEIVSGNKKSDAFILEKTSPEQAIKILGKPRSDEIKKLDIVYIDGWVDEKIKKENCRVLHYSPLEDFKNVNLTFLDNRLIAIEFEAKKTIKAAQLSNIYKIKLIPIVNVLGIKRNVDEFDNATKDVSVSEFPQIYYLVGTSQSSVLTAKIFNGEVKSGNIGITRNLDPQIKVKIRPITGKVTEIQILSRKILK